MNLKSMTNDELANGISEFFGHKIHIKILEVSTH